MSILIDKTTRVLVQGITGREGRLRARLMAGYGTSVAAGVTPGKGGQEVDGVPVYNTVAEAVEKKGPFDLSAVFVPAPLVKAAAVEALAAGVGSVLLVPDRVPLWDTMEIIAAADDSGAVVIGPNTLGICSPGQALAGMIGGRAEFAGSWFTPGPVGVASRSGGITATISYLLTQRGLGQSTIVHVGGDSVVGFPLPAAVEAFGRDPDTRAVVIFGEIGTRQEEQVAEIICRDDFNKPLVAMVGGAAAIPGVRFSHAGAIVEGESGSYESKVESLKSAGALIARSLDEVPELVAGVL
jgi:succinyl-CoA synthetase alpha subunit